MKKLSEQKPQKSELILYQTEDGKARISVRIEGETVCLSQKQLAELFQKDIRTIHEHIRNIFEERELEADLVIRKFRIVQNEGKRQVSRKVSAEELDLIIEGLNEIIGG